MTENTSPNPGGANGNNTEQGSFPSNNPEAPLQQDHLGIDPAIHIATPVDEAAPTRIEVRHPQSPIPPSNLDHLKIDPNIHIARPTEHATSVSSPVSALPNTDESLGVSPETNPEEKIGFEEARDIKYQAYINKTRGPAFGKRARELTESYIVAEQQYTAVFQEQLTIELEEKLSAGITIEEAKLFIKDRVVQTIKEDEANQSEMLKESYGAIGKAMEWYGKQTTLKKIAIGAGLGVAALTVGVGIGFMGGLIGAGAAATGAFSLASRTGRAYFTQLSALFKESGEIDFEEINDISEVSDVQGVESVGLRKTGEFMLGRASDRMLEAEKIKKRAVKWAMGAAALVGASGVVGAVWHVAQDASLEHLPGGQIQHQVEDMLNPSDTGVDDTPETIPVPEETVTREELINSYIAEHPTARKIRPGEGWYQTFKELGIKRDNWDELLKDMGPKLRDMEYKGTKLAYWDEQANEWRINMTENGKMPKSALRLIIERAEEKGYMENPLGLEELTAATQTSETVLPTVSAPETASVDTASVADNLIKNPESSAEFSAVSTISKGESVTTMLDQLNKAGVINVESGQYNALMKVAGPELAKLHYPDGTPVAYPFRRFPYDWRLYMSPDGRLHPDAIRLLERLSRQGNYTLAS